ncbi:MAG: hypothetical protein AAGA68_24520 [Pseudomonadota bacterium]
MAVEQSIVDFFHLYASRFSSGDVAGITALWRFPALITAGARSVAFEDEESFAKNTVALCNFYDGQGVTRAEKTVLSADEHYPGVTTARTGDRLYGSDGSLIIEWEHVYLLRREGSHWKTMVAVADGEATAWEARGTPLGSQ